MDFDNFLATQQTALIEQYKQIVKQHNILYLTEEYDTPILLRCEPAEQAFMLPLIRNQFGKVQPMWIQFSQETDLIGDYFNYLTRDQVKWGDQTLKKQAISIFIDVLHDVAKTIAELYGISFISDNDKGIITDDVVTFKFDVTQNQNDEYDDKPLSSTEASDIDNIVQTNKREMVAEKEKEEFNSKIQDWNDDVEAQQLIRIRENMSRINEIKSNPKGFGDAQLQIVLELFPELQSIDKSQFKNNDLDYAKAKNKNGATRTNFLKKQRTIKYRQAVFNRFIQLAKNIQTVNEEEMKDIVTAQLNPTNVQKPTDKTKIDIISDDVISRTTFKIKTTNIDQSTEKQIFPGNEIFGQKGDGKRDKDDDDICGMNSKELDEKLKQMIPSLLDELDFNTKKLIVENKVLLKDTLTGLTYNNQMGLADRYGAKKLVICDTFNNEQTITIIVTFDDVGHPLFNPRIQLSLKGSIDAITWRSTRVITELPKFNRQREILKRAHICVDESTDDFYTRKLMDKNNEGWAEAMTVKEIFNEVKIDNDISDDMEFVYSSFSMLIEKFDHSVSRLSLDFDSYLIDIIANRTVSYTFPVDLISILDRYKLSQVQVDYTGYFKVIKNKRMLSYNKCKGNLEDKFMNVTNEGKVVYNANDEIEYLLNVAYYASTFAVTGSMSINNIKLLLDSVIGYAFDETPLTVSSTKYTITFKSTAVTVVSDNPDQEGFNLIEELSMRTHKRMTRCAIFRYMTLLPWFNICLNLIRDISSREFKELMRLIATYLMLLYAKDETKKADNPPRRVYGEVIMDKNGIPLTEQRLDTLRQSRKEALGYAYLTPRQEGILNLPDIYEEKYVYDTDSVADAINNTGTLIDNRFTSFIVIFLSMLCAKK